MSQHMACYCGWLNRDLLLKADSKRLQTSMPGVGFEPADYSTKWQHPTIRSWPSYKKKNSLYMRVGAADIQWRHAGGADRTG